VSACQEHLIRQKFRKTNIYYSLEFIRCVLVSVRRGYGDHSPLTTAATLEWRCLCCEPRAARRSPRSAWWRRKMAARRKPKNDPPGHVR
jgi:hypothetical protein